MVELSDEAKRALKAGKKFLEENKVEEFYDFIADNDLEALDVGSITQWFLDRGINPLKYCTNVVPWAMFYYTDIESIDIPEGITGIDNHAFQGCVSLTHAVIPDSMESIGSWAFIDCPKLKQLELPSNINCIDKSAFDGGITLFCYTYPEMIDWEDDYYDSRYNIIQA